MVLGDALTEPDRTRTKVHNVYTTTHVQHKPYKKTPGPGAIPPGYGAKSSFGRFCHPLQSNDTSCRIPWRVVQTLLSKAGGFPAPEACTATISASTILRVVGVENPTLLLVIEDAQVQALRRLFGDLDIPPCTHAASMIG